MTSTDDYSTTKYYKKTKERLIYSVFKFKATGGSEESLQPGS